jgi:hypothetical protein
VPGEITRANSIHRLTASLRDRVLVGVWVFSYAVILWIFRVLKRIEDRKSGSEH